MGNRHTKSRSQSSDGSSSDKSSFSSVKRFRIVEGRQFHNQSEEDAIYALPCDINEQDRLTLQHYVLRFAWQSNFSAPVQKLLKVREPQARVLDVGCGTGIWTLEMASDYPMANFDGIDIAPVFPEEIKPKNVTFHLANVNNGIPFPDETFDYVFMRFMVLSFTEEQWREKVIPEILRVTKIGGYVELFESNIGLSTEGECMRKFSDALKSYLIERGCNPNVITELPKMLSESGGFESPIKIEHIDIPVGCWGGKIGKLMGYNMEEALKSLKIPLSKQMGISYAEYDEYSKAAVTEFEIHMPTSLTGRVYGRRNY